MTLEERITSHMNNKHPEVGSMAFDSGKCPDVQFTHRSFMNSLNYAKKGSSYYYDCLSRCYEWLKALKKNDIKLIDNPSPSES
jgi:hypothetical protein